MGKKKLNNVASIDLKSLEIEENEEIEVEELTSAEEGNTNTEEKDMEEEVNLYIEEIEDENDEEHSIPKNIFLNHKSLVGVNSKPQLKKCLESWIQYKNPYKIHFFTDEMCNNFMKKHFSEKIYKAYCRLPTAIMKSELWRYCVIYIHGGIYTDSDAECIVTPNIFTSAKSFLVCVPDNNIHLCQWCFAAPKNSPILKSIIDLSVKRILEITEIKGEQISHYLTGPACFTTGVELYLKENNHTIYGNKLDYQKYRNNILCVFNKTNFDKLIHHHFSSVQPSGWPYERIQKLM